jgi:hypothetical protein
LAGADGPVDRDDLRGLALPRAGVWRAHTHADELLAEGRPRGLQRLEHLGVPGLANLLDRLVGGLDGGNRSAAGRTAVRVHPRVR